MNGEIRVKMRLWRWGPYGGPRRSADWRTLGCSPRLTLIIFMALLLGGCGGDQPYDDEVGLPGEKEVPTPPSSLSLLFPNISPGLDNTPTIRVGGVKSGDRVGLFTDANCSNSVGSGTASGGTIDITSSALTAGSYTFYATVTQAETSDCSTASVNYHLEACPISFVSVPGDATLGTADFCVMQFEAKAWNDQDSDGIVDAGEVEADGCSAAPGACLDGNSAARKPVSMADNLPWIRLSQIQARDACADLNGGVGSKYYLLTNPEWMTIARNIENQKANWSGGTVGLGAIFQGNIYNNSDSGYDGNNPEAGTGRNFKARHVLSNGEHIWDLSGNVAEWVDWKVAPTQKAYSSADGAPLLLFRELNLLDRLISLTDEMFPNSWQPSQASYGSGQGIGQYYAGDSASGGAAFRGGSYNDNLWRAGIFYLNLDLADTETSAALGFRCAYRP